MICSITHRRQKLYSLDQVDRVRLACLLIEEMGVNLERVEIAVQANLTPCLFLG